MRRLTVGVILLTVVTPVGLWTAPLAMAQEQPRRGAVLRVALAAFGDSIRDALDPKLRHRS